MGRGLSDLQRRVLLAAEQRHAVGKSIAGTPGIEVLIQQLCVEVLGWTPTSERQLLGGQWFSEPDSEMRSQRSALSRAIRRLEKRGLLLRLKVPRLLSDGIRLTDAGHALAVTLSRPACQEWQEVANQRVAENRAIDEAGLTVNRDKKPPVLTDSSHPAGSTGSSSSCQLATFPEAGQ